METQNNEHQNSSTPNTSTMTNNTVMAVLSYIGPLVIVAYLMSKGDEFVKFHTKQGMVVFGIEVLAMIFSPMMYSFWMILNIVNLATLVLSVIGIVNVIQGNKKELPIVGSLAKNFNF